MDRYSQLDELLQRLPAVPTTLPSILAFALGGLFFLHQVLVYLDFAVLSPLEIAWNAIIYVTPIIVLLDRNRRAELRAQKSPWSQIHAAKSEALRNMLGLGSRAVMQQLPAGANLVRGIGASKTKPKSDAPPGLGNWDNSCYQNSVLQGLSAVDSLKPYLAAFSSHEALPKGSTSSSLRDVVQKLNSADNNGSHIWTPAKLKSMSSWQQQDAQEYYSKIVDDLEKEASKVYGAAAVKPGLESSEKKKRDIASQLAAPPFSVPLEGLLAQRVACTRCGFSEGLSMIPFNCLTVPLGSSYEYDLSECLDEYTQIEDIPEVECAKCTLLRAKSELNKMLPQSPEKEGEENKAMQLPPELREKIGERLRAVNNALDNDDFSDKTLKELCQISKKARVSSTKTRQAIVGRAPRSLVVHVNRSVFDEMTGAQKKNYAAVRYPQVLDLGKWMLGSKQLAAQSPSPTEQVISDASQSMLANRSEHDQCLYRLKAVITHYGRHENGHYIAYRQHPPSTHAGDSDDKDGASDEPEDLQPANSDMKLPWWRLSDEDVSSVPDEDVLRQGGVFMLFYEREEELKPEQSEVVVKDSANCEGTASVTATSEIEAKSNANEPAEAEEASNGVTIEAAEREKPSSVVEDPTRSSEASADTMTEEESEADMERLPTEAVKPVPVAAAQPHMRTSRADSTRGDSGLTSPPRAIEAT